FVISEGAGVVVVEELEHARQRGAKIYCEITGYGLSADAYHMTAPPPDGEGAARAMQLALEHARVSPDQVDYINAHATSTDIGDLCETRAIKQVFGEHAYKVSISSTKSITGHLLGGAGGVEMAACALAIRDSVIPPKINLENPGGGCDLDYTANVAREKKVRVVLNNSFGFGGHNATLVATAFEKLGSARALACCDWRPRQSLILLSLYEAAWLALTILHSPLTIHFLHRAGIA